MREEKKLSDLQYEKSENDVKAMQSGGGQQVGEVLRPLPGERFVVKCANGPRYLVGCRGQIDRNKLKVNLRMILLI